MDEMTVGRALKEIKLLDARIAKQTQGAVFIDAYQEKNKKLWRGHTARDVFEKNAKADYDSIVDLIARRNKIKTAILVSNATQTVTIGNETFVVIEAIERKRSIELDRALLGKMQGEFTHVRKHIDNTDASLKNQISEMLKQNVSAERVLDKADYDRIAAPFREDNELKMVDPLQLEQRIKKLDETIDRFMNDVDYALSESNATTKIQI